MSQGQPAGSRRSPWICHRGAISTVPRPEQGLSVGWVDDYPFYLPEQWIDLGQTPLADGDYVLRVVADPMNQFLESPDKADPARESPAANEGVTFFSLQQGCPDEALLALPRVLACPDPNEPMEDEDSDDGETELPVQVLDP